MLSVGVLRWNDGRAIVIVATSAAAASVGRELNTRFATFLGDLLSERIRDAPSPLLRYNPK